MKILGIDSSGLVASVAVVEDEILLGEYSTNYKKTHSQTLLPMLDELKKMIELDLDSLDAIAISAGPGSFTGLRIGQVGLRPTPFFSVIWNEGELMEKFGVKIIPINFAVIEGTDE